MSKVRAAPCCVESADINWNDAQTPESNTFGDVYFSRDDGKAESEYVFLQQNNLSERWQELKEQNIPFSFTIVETGFGTGLNFLNAIALWRNFDFAPNQQLHFVSAEKYPIRKADLARALLTRWPELQDDVERLLSIYPPSLRGVHRREFATNINLTLVFEDAFIGFNNLQFTADAWFLDGFAPSKNPELWQTDLLGTLGCKSKHGTTFSTFSAVGVIRRSLIQNGFRVEKVKGFGRKREMLRGIFERSQLQAEKLDQIENLPETPRRVQPKQAPWFVDAESNYPRSSLQTTPPNIAIIGAGLAGCFTARALNRRGASTTVFDLHASPGQEASGNPQGILYTKPGATYAPSTQFGLLALTYSQHVLTELAAFLPQIWHPTGVLQLAYQEKEKVQQQKLITQNNYPNQLLHPVSPEEASIIAGIDIPHSGIFYPESGWVRPAELCKALLTDPIVFIGNDRVVDISNESNDLWTLTTASGTRHSGFTHVVIANSSSAKQFRETSHLPLKPIRGQTSLTPSTPYSGQLKTAVCAKGYIEPAQKAVKRHAPFERNLNRFLANLLKPE
ncbi:MAG: FAD-dependent 5-carboxymethylaminomethyl-2-thiouridine(34) oxidoreductase MnmC [Pseudomonadales bacterium]|nr:FAD-dependent 5-carboxymethylaminomethyl-2-thiouridine(34) oxidoreductase MnmC [Pseudomonadales bacterium]